MGKGMGKDMGKGMDDGVETKVSGVKTEEGSRCLVCGRLTTGGLDIRGRRICPRCERILCTVDPSNPRYRYYMRVLGGLWQGFDLAPQGENEGINSKE